MAWRRFRDLVALYRFLRYAAKVISSGNLKYQTLIVVKMAAQYLAADESDD